MTSPRLPIAAILALGVTQNIGYGTLYYSFSILAPDMARGFGWSTEWVFGLLSVALLAGGITAPWLGRWLDQFGAGRVMTAGSVIAAAALASCAVAPNGSAFAVALIIVEIAANFVQYGAAFALLVQLSPQTAQRSITYLTLLGGFASTIFWPVTATLHEQLAWQNIYLIFASLNLLVCVPIHAWLSSKAQRTRHRQTSGPKDYSVQGALHPKARRTGFLLMVVGFSLQSFISAALLVHMVPLLSSIGLGAMAAVVGALFGPSQVASRLTNMLFGKALPPLGLAIVSASCMAVATVVLLTSAPSVIGAMAFAVLFGFGNGLFSITSGTLPLSLFGSDGYGRLQGKVMSARLIVSAAAPFAFAMTMRLLGAKWSLGVTSTLALAAICVLYAISLMHIRSERR